MSVTIAIRRVIGSISALTIPTQRDEMLLSRLVLTPHISLGHHNSILALLQPWQHRPPVVHLQSLIMSNFSSIRLTWLPLEGVPPSFCHDYHSLRFVWFSHLRIGIPRSRLGQAVKLVISIFWSTCISQ
ncbi:uncharacterized protein LOC131328048 [Rhododendron vialii]|uniref:uncharacterized protein LOC131328048 n=1 Tax=Rhododendron vialii TaxID=182163 RepID=UPI00265E0DF8|nr:uncharacterized protein LOC131328048 [Rhododendron vialii]